MELNSCEQNCSSASGVATKHRRMQLLTEARQMPSADGGGGLQACTVKDTEQSEASCGLCRAQTRPDEVSLRARDMERTAERSCSLRPARCPWLLADRGVSEARSNTDEAQARACLQPPSNLLECGAHCGAQLLTEACKMPSAAGRAGLQACSGLVSQRPAAA